MYDGLLAQAPVEHAEEVADGLHHLMVAGMADAGVPGIACKVELQVPWGTSIDELDARGDLATVIDIWEQAAAILDAQGSSPAPSEDRMSDAVIRGWSPTRRAGRIGLRLDVLRGPHHGRSFSAGVTTSSSVWPYVLRSAGLDDDTRPWPDVCAELVGRQVRVHLGTYRGSLQVERWLPAGG